MDKFLFHKSLESP